MHATIITIVATAAATGIAIKIIMATTMGMVIQTMATAITTVATVEDCSRIRAAPTNVITTTTRIVGSNHASSSSTQDLETTEIPITHHRATSNRTHQRTSRSTDIFISTTLRTVVALVVSLSMTRARTCSRAGMTGANTVK